MKYLVYIIFGIVLFLIIRKVIGRVFPKLKTVNNLISGLLAIGLSPIIAKVVFILFFNLLMFEYHPNRKFEVDSWQENTEDRHQMSADLIESKILLEKTKKQIADKIGLPNNKIDLEKDTISNWRYRMGNRGWGFGFKFYYLEIGFKNSKSTSVNIEESID